LPILRNVIERPDINTICDAVDTSIQKNELLARQIKLYLCHRYSGQKLKPIGNYFRIGEPGVTQASGRFSVKVEQDKGLKREMKKIMRLLKLC